MDTIEYIIKSDAIPNRKNMGGKAFALNELGAKFNIPEYFVISPKAFLDCLSEEQKQKLAKGEPVGEIHLDKAVEAAIASAVANTISSASAIASTISSATSKKDSETVDEKDTHNFLFAVRSSATAEDGEHASFAGQLDSFLNVPCKDVAEKVKGVWYSAFSEHVTQYRKTFAHGAEWIPAVIIQKMVNADVAGVAFSADPVTGDLSKCVINATQGLADKLVSGEVNGDTYHTCRKGMVETQILSLHSNVSGNNVSGNNVSGNVSGNTGNEAIAILSKENIHSIVELLLKVEGHFGTPQDIEWAIENGTLYLLQARPITSLQHQSLIGKQIIIWDNSNIVESYSGVTSPLTFSFARYAYEHVYVEFCKFMGVSRDKVEREHNVFRNMLGYVNGHVYYNLLNWYRFIALFPGFKMNRKFMEQMMGVKKPLPEEIVESIVSTHSTSWEKIKDGFGFARTLGGLVWHQIVLQRTSKRFYNRLNEALSSSENLENFALDQLAGEYRILETKLLKRWDAPLVNDFLCMIAFGVSRKLLEKYAGEAGLNLHNDIMIGQGDIISAEPAIRIGKMATIINASTMNKNEAITKRLISGDITAIESIPELKKEYEEYLHKFGDRCLQELKLESSTLHDDPSMLLKAIGYMARKGTQAKEVKVPKDIKAEMSNLFQNKAIKQWIVSKTVVWAKARVRDRENLRFERTRIFGRVRKIFLEIGKRFHELKYINNPRDIFFLEVFEIIGLIEGTATTMDLSTLIESRKKQQARFESQAVPPNRFRTHGACYPAFNAQSYHAELISEKLEGNSVKGIACCQGLVQAPVRVITNPRDAELKPGEIMVAAFTDPGWITLFANASGILVERGSLLSHSAIVSREMGIPAIVAIDGLMTWLKTGDIVEMNGTTGIVRKIE